MWNLGFNFSFVVVWNFLNFLFFQECTSIYKLGIYLVVFPAFLLILISRISKTCFLDLMVIPWLLHFNSGLKLTFSKSWSGVEVLESWSYRRDVLLQQWFLFISNSRFSSTTTFYVFIKCYQLIHSSPSSFISSSPLSLSLFSYCLIQCFAPSSPPSFPVISSRRSFSDEAVSFINKGYEIEGFNNYVLNDGLTPKAVYFVLNKIARRLIL